MPSPKIDAKCAELITDMHSKTEVLISDISNIKESQKELRKEFGDIRESITDLKVCTKVYAESLQNVKCELEEHKKEHNQAFGKILAVLGVVATFISITITLIFNHFRK